MNLNELIITIANESHIPYLKEIWRLCFGDSKEYIDFFFKNRFDTCIGITALYNGKPIAGMYLMPVTTYEYGVLKSGYYAYAIGILPEYRGNGIYAYIQSKLYDYVRDNDKFIILCPANEKLCEYYKSLGYIENAYVSERVYTINENLKNYGTRELITSDYERLRKSYTEDKNAIIWNNNALRYVLLENKFTSGENLLIDYNDTEIFAVIRKNANSLVITESNAPPETRQALTDFLCTHFNVEKIKWITPDEGKNNRILYGLSCNLKKDYYYLNLILN